jgi:ubiquinone/menaquinone biosynthesis C-methylase UbiE
LPAQSIAAYDLPARVASYDADMEVMHPNRAAMVSIALDFLPFPPEAPLEALDLGIGTGYFSSRFLDRFPNGRVTAVDGAEAMLDLARARLIGKSSRIDCVIGDFRHLSRLLPGAARFDLVFSSYALHHLDASEKQDVVARSLRLLRPDGWFLNADLIVSAHPRVEARIQCLREDGVLRRRAQGDSRFGDRAAVRAFLDGIETRDGDRPVTLMDDLRILERAGASEPAVLWAEHREAVFAARAPSPPHP